MISECGLITGMTLIKDIASFHKVASKTGLPNNKMTGMSLKNAVFHGLDFSYYNMSDSIFENCIFVRCNLSFANLSKCLFDSVKIYSTMFKYTNLMNSFLNTVEIYKSDFRSAILAGVTLRGVNIEKSNFAVSDLQSSTWLNIKIDISDFSYSNISNAELRNVSMERCILFGARLCDSRVVSVNISHCSMILCNIRYSYFLNVHLKNVPVISLKCYHTVFLSLILEQVNMSVCDEICFIKIQNRPIFDSYSLRHALNTPFVEENYLTKTEENSLQQYAPDRWNRFKRKPLYLYCGIDEYYLTNGYLRFRYSIEVLKIYRDIKNTFPLQAYDVLRMLSCCFEDFGLGYQRSIKNIICHDTVLLFLIENKDLSVPWIMDVIFESIQSELLNNRKILYVISVSCKDRLVQMLEIKTRDDHKMQRYVKLKAIEFIEINYFSDDSVRRAIKELQIEI